MIEHLFNATVQIRHPVWQYDRYGNRTADWTDAMVTTVGGRIWMTASREEEKDRDTSVTTWFLIVSPSTLVDHHCRVVYTDPTGVEHSYDVEGVQPHNTWRGLHHWTVRLTEVEGWT